MYELVITRHGKASPLPNRPDLFINYNQDHTGAGAVFPPKLVTALCACGHSQSSSSSASIRALTKLASGCSFASTVSLFVSKETKITYGIGGSAPRGASRPLFPRCDGCYSAAVTRVNKRVTAHCEFANKFLISNQNRNVGSAPETPKINDASFSI